VSSKVQGDNHDDEHDDEDDWLLARERGQPGPAVSEETVRRYAQLQSLIKDLPAMPAGVTSRVGWEQDVLAAIDKAEAEPGAPRNSTSLPPPTPAAPQRMSRSRRWAAAAVSIGIAAVVVILLALHRDRGGATVPTLAFEVQPGSRLHRGADPSVGDKLIVRGVIEGPGELRIYDAAGVEQARCTGPSPGCTVDRADQRTALQLTMLLRAPGALRAVLFAAPLGAASRGLDGDLEAARRAGIAMATLEPVEVH
jgi:hypothetical protein